MKARNVGLMTLTAVALTAEFAAAQSRTAGVAVRGGKHSQGASLLGSNVPDGTGWFPMGSSTIYNNLSCPACADSALQGVEGLPAIVNDWAGGMSDTSRDWLLFHGGGHNGYYGNQVYRLNMKTGVLDILKQPTAPPVPNCAESFANGEPVAKHTYNGQQHISAAGQDWYFSWGGGLPTCGNFGFTNWKLTPTSPTWTNLNPANPLGNSGGSYPQTAYSEADNKLYGLMINDGRYFTYNPVTNAYTVLRTFGAIGCSQSYMTTVIDPVRRNYLCVGGGGIAKIQMDTPFNATTLTGTGCGTLLTQNAPGFQYDKSLDKMVGWATGDTIYIYDPVADSCATQAFTGGPGTPANTGTYGRFRYFPDIGAYGLVNRSGQQAFAYRTQKIADADWGMRKNAAGVVKTWDADSFTGVTVGLDCGGVQQASIDTTTKVSGTGSLRFKVPAAVACNNTSGQVILDFGQTFGPGSDLYWMYRWRGDSTMVNTAMGGDGWKVATVYGGTSGCANLSVLVQHLFNNPYPVASKDCGSTGFEFTDAGAVIHQADTTPGNGIYCNHSAPTPTSCIYFIADQWMTFYGHVHYGSSGVANSTVELWAQRSSSDPWIKWVNFTDPATGGHGFVNFNDSVDLTGGFSKITLLPYNTNKPANGQPPVDAFVWYDEVVISSQPIVCPTGCPTAWVH